MLNYEQKKYRVLLILSIIFSFVIPMIITTILRSNYSTNSLLNQNGNFYISVLDNTPLRRYFLIDILIISISNNLGISLIVISALAYSFKKSMIVAMPYLAYNLISNLYYFFTVFQISKNSFTTYSDYSVSLHNFIIQFILEMLIPIIIIAFTRLFISKLNKQYLAFLVSAIIIFIFNIVYFFINFAANDSNYFKGINTTFVDAIYLYLFLPNIKTFALNLLIILCAVILYFYIEKRITNKKIKNT